MLGGWSRACFGLVLLAAVGVSTRATMAQAPRTDEEQLSVAQQIETFLNGAEDRIADVEKEGSGAADAAQKFTEATQIVDEVLKADPLNKRAGYLKGRLAILRGRPREALPLIEDFATSKEGVNVWFAQKLLGDLYVSSYPEQACIRYKDAIKLAPDQPAPYIGLADAEIRLSRGTDAVASARKAISLDTEETVKYREVLAEALLLLPDGQVEAAKAARDAVAITERRIREDPGDLAQLTTLLAEYELLFKCYKALAQVEKDSPEIVVDVARTAQDKADLERLIAYHSALILVEQSRLDPKLAEDVPLMFEAARINRMVGRNDRAIELLHEVLKKQPNHDGARELLRLLGVDPSQDGATADAEATP